MIPITASSELTQLIEALSRDIVDARIHYRMFRDLHQALTAKPIVEAQARTFWSLTLTAHLEHTIHMLCRIYDQNVKALHLYSWLRTIRENIVLFNESHFRERLKDNPYVDSLAANPRKPDPRMLEDDIFLCSAKELLVKTLLIHRGNRIAHRKAADVVAGQNIGDRFPLTYGDVEALLERAVTILNRYSDLFAANTYSTQIIGHNDFEFVLTCVETVVKERRSARKALRESRRNAET